MQKISLSCFLFMIGLWASAQCPADVLISGIYPTVYTNSHTWIASSGATTIPSAADVTLDANPLTDGYVLLDVGFETQPGAVFLAVVQTPCALLAITQPEASSGFELYPNPANNWIYLSSAVSIRQTEIYDVQGRLVFHDSRPNSDQAISVNTFPSGIYLVKVYTEKGVETRKFAKQ